AILVPILARLLYFSISRKREYLADASGVRLSRYPEGLASALEKISDTKLNLESANKVTAPMYIINPLKKKSMKISNLSSTHPPITERVRILRAMQHGANYSNYQQAYSTVRGGGSVIPKSGMADTEEIGIRSATTGKAAAKRGKATQRKMGDIMMAVNDYSFIPCACGVKLKVPPTYKKKLVSCPKCGKQHAV
ncbi:MAG: M48 family metalloprotease, partial [Bacteroidales bacterium]|nr:M48 family metalloprotease [Bacteroidales bacterium]